MKTTFLISLAAVLSTPLYAQCLPEEGRFEKATIDYHGTNYWVINDNRTNLQWMMCPMGQQGEQCAGDAILEKRGNLVELIETFNQAESDAALTWRLPHTQELITITDQSCRYGTYPETLSCHNRPKHWSSYIKPLLRTKRSSMFSTNDTKTTWLHWRKNVSPTRR